MKGYGTQNGRTAFAQGMVTPSNDRIDPGRNRTGAPDQVIKEIRALREFKNWKFKQLSERYSLTVNQIRQIINGSTGAFVTHSEEDLP